jgi:hypothetical protein
MKKNEMQEKRFVWQWFPDGKPGGSMTDAFAKTLTMAKQKIRPTRLGGFSGTKAYI